MRFLLLLTFGIFLVAHSADFAIVTSSKPAVCIEKNEQLLAHSDFFIDIVKECTGAELPYGDTGKTIRFKVENRPILKEDSYAISFTDDNTMLITGSVKSIRWALNSILEKYARVRFLSSGKLWTHCPKSENISIPANDVSVDAKMHFYRNLWTEEKSWADSLNGKGDWTFHDENLFMHNLLNIFPIAKYAKDKWADKIMPLRNGKRLRPTSGTAWQPCFSNPATTSEAINNICAYFDEHPEKQFYSLSVNDLEGFCECPECLKMNGGLEKTKYSEHFKNWSPLYYGWCNKVVEGVLSKHPDVYFGVIAYCSTYDPPPFKLNSHIAVTVCLESYQIVDEKTKKNHFAMISEWSEKADSIIQYDYAYGMKNYSLPRVYPHVQAEVMKFFALHKCEGAFAESASLAGEGPKRYLFYKLAYDPSLDVDELLKDWYEAAVGKQAAIPLAKYFDFWEKFWTGDEIRKAPWFRPGGVYLSGGNCLDYISALKHEDLIQCRQWIDEMLSEAKASGTPAQQKRAEQLGHYFDYYEAKAYACGAGTIKTSGKIETPEEALAFLKCVPRMSKYYKLLQPAVNQVVQDRNVEIDKLVHSLIIPAFMNTMGHVDFSVCMNKLKDYLDDAAVRQQMRNIIANPEIDPIFSGPLKDLLNLENCRNLFWDAFSTEAEKDLWHLSYSAEVEPQKNDDGTCKYLVTSKGGWTAPQRLTVMRPQRTYYYSVRITPQATPERPFAPFSARLLLVGAHRTRFYQQNGYQTEFTRFDTPEPKTIRLLTSSPSSASLGRAYVIFDNLKAGTQILLDQFELLELGSSEIAHHQKTIPLTPEFWELKDATLTDNGDIELNAKKILSKYSLDLQENGKNPIILQICASGSSQLLFGFEGYDENGKYVAYWPNVWGGIDIPDYRQTFEFELNPADAIMRKVRFLKPLIRTFKGTAFVHSCTLQTIADLD